MKNMITALSSIGGAVVGSAVGTVTGIMHAPVVAGMAITAPVSYPLMGVGSALIHMDGYTTGERVAAGLAIGVCLIPLAPINLITSPLTPVAHAVVGAVAGGVGAGVYTHKHLKGE